MTRSPLSALPPTHGEAERESALEREARQIAATKCGLVKDTTGANLPPEIWRQALPQARAKAHHHAERAVLDAATALELWCDDPHREGTVVVPILAIRQAVRALRALEGAPVLRGRR